MILAPLQKLPKNVKDLGKLIVPKGIKKLLKVQKIANYGHTVGDSNSRLFNESCHLRNSKWSVLRAWFICT